MGRHGKYYFPHTSICRHRPDKSTYFVMRKICTYLDRLLVRHRILDENTWEFIEWLLGADAVKCLDFIAEKLNVPSIKSLETYESFGRFDFASFVETTINKNREALEAPMVQFVRTLLKAHKADLQYKGPSDIERNLARLKSVFHLTPLESEIYLFLFISSVWTQVESYFENSLGANRYVGRSLMATILGTRESDLLQAVHGKLSDTGIVNTGGGSFDLEWGFVDLLQNPAGGEFTTDFFKRISPKPFPGAAEVVEQERTHFLLNLLRATPDTSTHVLFHGPPGTGKTTYAYELAYRLGIPAYETTHAKYDTYAKQRASITAAATMVAHNRNSLVLVDDANMLLNTYGSFSMFGNAGVDRTWLHRMLELPGVRMLWILNDVYGIEESVARRFSMSVEFKPFRRSARIALWRSVLNANGLEASFGEGDIRELAGSFHCSAGAVDIAVRTAVKASNGDPEGLRRAVVHALESNLTQVLSGASDGRLNHIEETYSVEGLNVDGNLPTMLRDLKALDQRLRHEKQGKPAPVNILLYGPSGTGKSELAKAIAIHLDREAVFTRGSDLYSCMFGSTEANIKEAFRCCSNSERVLIIDEADQLLMGRDLSGDFTRSFVNEILQQLESFRGVCILTTNRLEDLDGAVLRRCPFKVGFDYLTPEGNIIFYRRLLTHLCPDPADADIERELKLIPRLTPGDFRVVRDRFSIKSPVERTHRMMCEALRDEARIKPSASKPIGF